MQQRLLSAGFRVVRVLYLHDVEEMHGALEHR